MSITTLPAAPSRSEPSTFAVKGDALLGALALFVTEANALETNVNTKEATVVLAEAVTVAAKATAQAAANYHGPWSSCAGAANVPYSVSHIGKYWQLVSNLANVAAKTPGTDPEWIVITGYYSRVNKTQADSPVTLVVGDCDGFKTYTNTGASGALQLNLPAGANGLEIQALVTAAQYVKIVANGAETISFLTATSAAGGYVRSNVVGNFIRLLWSGTQWIVINIAGSWTYDS